MKNLRPLVIIFIGIAILVVASFSFQDFFEESEPAHGSDLDKISGFAWSDNIGWISFNCTDTSCVSTNYGVDINFDTGDFSGFAWSDSVGWITFDPTGAPPAAPNWDACLDIPNPVTTEPCNGIGDYKVSGWARVFMCDDNPADCDGWDGWIKLGDSSRTWNAEAPDTQVRINLSTLEFEGWAWGDEVIGWISFNCKGPDMCGE